jgi:sugar phosphate isomerase/epimerase
MPTQKFVVEVGMAAFGESNLTDPKERALRFYEEANEAARAAGLSYDEMLNVLDYEWSRPAGELSQELAGAQLTLFSLAAVNGIDLEAVTDAEIIRILRNIDACRAKHKLKPSNVKAA